MLRSDYIDPMLDFRTVGYHKHPTFDVKGDRVTLQYYEVFYPNLKLGDPGFDPEATYVDPNAPGYVDGNEFDKLKVSVERAYSRNGATGLLESRTRDIKFHNDDEAETVSKTIPSTKHYRSKEGYVGNQKARTNLVEIASVQLIKDIIAVDPLTQAWVDDVTIKATDFGMGMSKERDEYILYGTLPARTALLDAIDNVVHADITVAMRTKMKDTLNVAY